ncbi:MAG: alpha/beta hydrolase [Rhodobacteraceae bacterium]|nr:alpha/beta hydrolase [Paracoccaceae bacterium]
MIPLVLIPGMMCDATVFLPQIETLSGNYAIQLAQITAHETIAELAAEILKQAPPKFALAGLSMGGIVAMEVMAQAPKRVDRIALLDTNPKAELPAAKSAREPQIEKVMSGKLREVMRDEMKPNYLYDGPNRQDILNLCMEMSESLGAEVFVRQSRALQTRPDQQELLKEIDVPALVLCGENDKPCPVEYHELMHSLIPNSTLVIVEKAGHISTLEQPKTVTKALLEWLEK